ncbi:hypothetical protein CSB93_7036 (plasmid) [Pseudomonas paraeruginosa]|uniref:Uncharacterized protein n=1 Tax=Pseudomonas paraeruginosa TaxID=2994495 RepID=A0A2R3IKT3_9PSED|nr:hypothetical protein CSB93_7036 [Pseudomonas paraeruginosa]
MIPTFQCPELRKHSGVGRFDLVQTERVNTAFPGQPSLLSQAPTFRPG